MPDVMLSKCAEAHCAAQGVPAAASGIFLEEEVRDVEEEPETAAETGATTAPAAPTAPVSQPGGTSTPQTPEKPATGQAAAPEVEKKTRAKKEAPAAPATAPDETAPDADDITTTFVNPPAEPVAKEEAGGWQNHVIAHITMQDIAGRKVGSLTPEEVKRLKEKWADKFAAKIALNPDKQAEADFIRQAFDFHFPKQ
jgi:hypothetical protein